MDLLRSFILGTLLLQGALAASDTNNLFVTDDRQGYETLQKRIEEAKTNRESLPAEEFPEGNWGAQTNGFQMSLRFERSEAPTSGQIMAIILLRNVTNRLMEYRVAFVPGEDGPIRLEVWSEGTPVKPAPAELPDMISSRTLVLNPGTQHKYCEDLGKRFALKPGTYTVRALLGTGCPQCFVVSSGEARIEIR